MGDSPDEEVKTTGNDESTDAGQTPAAPDETVASPAPETAPAEGGDAGDGNAPAQADDGDKEDAGEKTDANAAADQADGGGAGA